jgi:hypothetical protein
MSGTWPTSPNFNAVNFKVNTPTIRTQPVSGRTLRVGMGHSFYTFTAKYNNLTRYDAGPIQGFIAQQFGPLEAFQIYLPELSFSKQLNQTTGAVQTSAAAAKGVDHVSVSGVQSGKGLLRAGDFFTFGNHTKVYQCAVTWSTGQPLYFSGSLVEDVPSGTGITYGSYNSPVAWTVIMDSDIQQWETGVGGIVNMSIDFREVW